MKSGRRRMFSAGLPLRAAKNAALLAMTAVTVLLTGCTQEMMDQTRFEPLEKSDFFEDGLSARPLVEGTVARGHLKTDKVLHDGLKNNTHVNEIPFPITREFLNRGRERFDIYCAVCHDRTGSSRGRVVQRGFTPPPSLHVARIREAPVGYIYEVIKNGLRNMPSYAHQIPVEDRWAIVAYMRALQLSQNATLEDVPADEKAHLAGHTP